LYVLTDDLYRKFAIKLMNSWAYEASRLFYCRNQSQYRDRKTILFHLLFALGVPVKDATHRGTIYAPRSPFFLPPTTVQQINPPQP
jgi:hypothetical protein